MLNAAHINIQRTTAFDEQGPAPYRGLPLRDALFADGSQLRSRGTSKSLRSRMHIHFQNAIRQKNSRSQFRAGVCVCVCFQRF